MQENKVSVFFSERTVLVHGLGSLVKDSRNDYFILLPRDAMHKRGLCCHAVSVRPSVTFVDHVKTNKYIFEIFFTIG